jgi:purine-binding chemotaxis protein CheW
MAERALRTTDSVGETNDQILARRAHSLALEAIETEITHRLSLLLFRIGEEWYAVRLAAVREIFQEYDITQIPCVPTFILGVVNVRGEILSVTDPARIMGIGQVVPVDGVMPPAVVVADGEVTTALVVEEIGDITEVADDALEPPVSIIDRSQAEFIEGSVFVDGTMVGLINVERILEPIGSVSRT